MSTLPLFEEPGAFDRAALRDRLAALASEGVFLGTSSWKYPGWLDQIYSRENYVTRGRFSQKRFEAECLREYASIFPVVCGDFSFYQFPSAEFWQRLFRTTPEPLRFAFKIPEEITVKLFPTHPRYGVRGGGANDSFLNAELLKHAFLDLLAPYRERVAVLIFEFGSFPKQAFRDAGELAAALNPFLAALPAEFRYAVEIRNPEFLEPEYFTCLREHGMAHVFSAWTRMPELPEQVEIADAFTAGFTVVRALLRRGRPYEEAVKSFSPYIQVQDLNMGARQAIGGLIVRARSLREPSYIYVNNRLEGNAPDTIRGIVDGL